MRDIGEVPVGSKPQVISFPFTNAGGETLEIASLTKSCRCADATVTATSLAPGERAELLVAVRPEQPEKKHASVALTTNDPDRPSVRAEVRWHAVAPLTPDPLELDLGVLQPGAIVERHIRLVRRDLPGSAGRAAGLSAVPRDLLAASWEGGPGSETHTTARVRFTAPAQPGTGAGAVVVALEDAWADSLRVPVTWEVRDVVAVKPSTVTFAADEPGAPATVRLMIVGNGPVSLRAEPEWEGPEGWRDVSATATRLTDERVLIELAGPLPGSPGRHAAALTVSVTVREDGAEKSRTLRTPVSAFVLEPAAVAARTFSEDAN